MTYVYHCALEKDGQFGLSLRGGSFLCIPKKRWGQGKAAETVCVIAPSPLWLQRTSLRQPYPPWTQAPPEPSCTNWAKRRPPRLPDPASTHKDQAHPSILSNCFNIWT